MKRMTRMKHHVLRMTRARLCRLLPQGRKNLLRAGNLFRLPSFDVERYESAHEVDASQALGAVFAGLVGECPLGESPAAAFVVFRQGGDACYAAVAHVAGDVFAEAVDGDEEELGQSLVGQTGVLGVLLVDVELDPDVVVLAPDELLLLQAVQGALHPLVYGRAVWGTVVLHNPGTHAHFERVCHCYSYLCIGQSNERHPVGYFFSGCKNSA